jgi:hypothetical protein
LSTTAANTAVLNLEYHSICKDFNTTYLDRDNTDHQTLQCMKKIMHVVDGLLLELLKNFDLAIYKPSSSQAVATTEVASKRFLFYSLEKAITLQSFSLQKEYFSYQNIDEWIDKNQEGLLLQNDEEGESLFIYVREGSRLHRWLMQHYDL